MGRFASGKFAYGISDRSGFRYKLNEMKREWTGMLVGPDEFETKQPQLEPRRKVSDPEALRNARPDRVEPLTRRRRSRSISVAQTLKFVECISWNGNTSGLPMIYICENAALCGHRHILKKMEVLGFNLGSTNLI